MSESDSDQAGRSLFGEQYEAMIVNLNSNLFNRRSALLERSLTDLLNCGLCKGQIMPSHSFVQTKKIALIDQEARFGFGSQPETAKQLDAMWYSFVEVLGAHLGTVQPCKDHQNAVEDVQQLLQQCVVFRDGLLANAEFLEGAMQYGQQMEAAGDLEEVVQFVEYLGAKLELDVETMSIPGCSFAPSSQ